MILASLIDAGVPMEYINTELAKTQIPGLSIDVENLKQNGISCRRLIPKWEQPKEYRHFHDILEIIQRGNYSKSVYDRCEKALTTLADAEAQVHGVPRETIHFHEIGAVDTIIDILGTCLALEYLEVKNIGFSSLTDGYGTITTAHGKIPVPVPAVAVMLKNYHVTRLDIPTEILTPTACALLTSLGSQSLTGPSGVVLSVGYSCGMKQFENQPNILRVFLYDDKLQADSGFQRDTILQIESDMDHLSGEVMGNTANLLMENGALDVSWIPLYMKKGRPAYRLSVMASLDDFDKLIDLIMLNTRTLGVRVQRVERVIYHRENITQYFHNEAIKGKRCSYKGHTFEKLEYDALAALSKQKGIPVIDLMEQFLMEKGMERNEQV